MSDGRALFAWPDAFFGRARVDAVFVASVRGAGSVAVGAVRVRPHKSSARSCIAYVCSRSSLLDAARPCNLVRFYPFSIRSTFALDVRTGHTIKKSHLLAYTTPAASMCSPSTTWNLRH